MTYQEKVIKLMEMKRDIMFQHEKYFTEEDKQDVLIYLKKFVKSFG